MSLIDSSTTFMSPEAVSAVVGMGAELLSSTEFGGWEPTALVAEGSMSHIYRAKASRSARPSGGAANNTGGEVEPAYAMKILKQSWHDNARAVELFAQEARLGRTISNPHVISVFASRIKSGRPPYYLVMPWLEGRTLQQELNFYGTFGFSEALWVLRQACEALHALNQAGYYHGDLKLSNLFFAPNGHVTLLDLGFARRIDEARSPAEQLVAGTYRYMAPETTSSVYASGPQSDIYSLGVIFFELLTGRPPFEGGSAKELIELHRGAPIPRLSRHRPGTPPYLCDLAGRLLAKQPDRRPSLSEGLIDELVRLEIQMFNERVG